MGKGQPSKKWEKYLVNDEELQRKNLFCPKCGPGVFMAEHEDRWHCGRCGYTMWKREEEK